MYKKLIIFDLDGTLLNTLSDLHCSVNFALAQEGLPGRSVEEVRSFLGNGILNLVQRCVPQNTDREKTLRVFDAFKSHYALHSMDSTAPYEGICELLEKLRSAGIRLGVVSNKADSAVKPIIAHYFPHTFDCVLGERDGVRKKPAPDSVFEVMQSLGCGPEESVYIGDSEVDILTAKNAGCDCISVSYGFRSRELLLESGAEVLCEAAADIANLLGL
ncbi:MAG: HAD-IA family hydrolase [Bacillota bacterium]|nr:HAD-IA family hydrolase [Bacillota bacterium]